MEYAARADYIDARRGPDYAFYLYNAKAGQEDQDFLDNCNGAMDSLLVLCVLTHVSIPIVDKDRQDYSLQ
jgi:hypothetical protein